MASPIGLSTSMVPAGSFESAKCLRARSRLCCDSLARSRWRPFHSCLARSLAVSAGLLSEKFPAAIPKPYLRHKSKQHSLLFLFAKNYALDMRVNVEGRRAQKSYECLIAVVRQLNRET